EGITRLDGLSTTELKKELLTYMGVGGKVADCISVFGFGKRDSFPVDTWIEQVYKEDFKGTLTDRNKITDYFVSLFGDKSGYIQQYLFYGKRQNL
ncbi:MAG: 8-oxoguanine DNA glycosylase, partial [Clostridia bacterium]|nr:8-oxoguanine DNA glycosylase [Clostridia bacterium]